MAAWMVYATVVAALTGVAAFALDRLVRPNGRPVRGIWAGAMVLGVGLPVIGLWSGPVASLLFRVVPGSTASAAQGSMVFLDPLIIGGSEGAFLTGALDPALGMVWLAASAWLLGRWIVARRRLRSLTGGTPARGSMVRPSSGSPDEDEILVTGNRGPAVVGFLRPRILLPRWLAEGDPECLDLVLSHEREHLAARDPALLTTSYVIRAVFPWNPVLWWMGRRLREAVEVDCDRRVLRQRPHSVRRYADTLLRVSRRHAGLAAFGAAELAEPTSLLERRIRAMTATRPKHRLLHGVLLGGVMLTALAMACSVPSPDGGADSPTGPPHATGAAVEESPPRTDWSGASPDDDSLGDLDDEATWTPYTVGPELRNLNEVRTALTEEYPPLLQDAGIGGTTVVWILVDEEGRVQRAEVKESAGHEALDRGALRVAEKMEFAPAREGADPVPVRFSLPITFQPS